MSSVTLNGDNRTRSANGAFGQRAAEIAAAASDGVVGVRNQLKAAERDLRGSLAAALAPHGETGKAIKVARFAVDLEFPDAIGRGNRRRYGTAMSALAGMRRLQRSVARLLRGEPLPAADGAAIGTAIVAAGSRALCRAFVVSALRVDAIGRRARPAQCPARGKTRFVAARSDGVDAGDRARADELRASPLVNSRPN